MVWCVGSPTMYSFVGAALWYLKLTIVVLLAGCHRVLCGWFIVAALGTYVLPYAHTHSSDRS